MVLTSCYLIWYLHMFRMRIQQVWFIQHTASKYSQSFIEAVHLLLYTVFYFENESDALCHSCVFLASPSPLCIHPHIAPCKWKSRAEQRSVISKYHVAIRIKKLGPALMHWTSLTETNEDQSNANNKNNTINDCGGIVLIYTIEDCSNTGRRFM